MLKLDDVRDKIAFNNDKIVPALEAAGESRLADRIRECGKFSQFATCTRCGARYYVATGGYCDSRFCSTCAKRRALAWLAKLMPLLEDYRKRGYLVFFLNLTIKDQVSLDVGLDVLTRAWRQMVHDSKLSRDKFRALNNGGVRSVEVKLGAGSGIWHPHIHAITILNSRDEVKQYDDYRELWESATRYALKTGDKVGSVYIHGVRDKSGTTNNEALMRGVVETFKYICKFEWLELSTAHIAELVRAVQGRRFIAAWGELYGLNKQVEALLNENTEEELKQQVCRHCGCTEFELDNLLTAADSGAYEYFDDRGTVYPADKL